MKLKNVKIEHTYALKSSFDCACLGPESEATHPGTATVTVIGICATTNQVKVKETNDWMPVEWLRKARNKPKKVALEELLAPDSTYKDHIYQAYKAHQQEQDEKLNNHLETHPISIEYMAQYGPLDGRDRYFYYLALCQDPRVVNGTLEGTGDTPEEALRSIIVTLKEVL